MVGSLEAMANSKSEMLPLYGFTSEKKHVCVKKNNNIKKQRKVSQSSLWLLNKLLRQKLLIKEKKGSCQDSIKLHSKEEVKFELTSR